MTQNKPGLETIALHVGQEEPDSATTARAVPIYATASYVFPTPERAANLFGLKEFGNIYSRIMNPTNDVFEKRVAAIEGGVGALAVSSGQSATTLALLNITSVGDEIVAGDNLYGGTYQLLHYTFERLGRYTKFVNADKPEEFKKAITPKTKAIYIETIGNPHLNVPDFEAIAKIAHDAGIPVVVDNTVGVGFFRPFEHGADIIVLSATKYIGGHGTTIGGVIVDSGNFKWDNAKFPEITDKDPSYHGLSYWDAFGNIGGANLAYILRARVLLLRDLGPALSPWASFLFLQGIEDLPLRQKKHSENALAVAQYLEKHPKVKFVFYPGLPSFYNHKVSGKYLKDGIYGGLVAFEVKGGVEAGKKIIESVKLFSHLANIGDAKSLIIHPASTTHQQLSEQEQLDTGVTPGLIRLSIGIEDVKDIIADLDQALAKV